MMYLVRLLPLFLMMEFVLVDATNTLATDLPLYGGPGGNSFRVECPPGSYLVGVDGRTGAWVDQLAPVCAPWLQAQKTFGAPIVGQSHGTSRGGTKRQRLCWGFGINNRAVQAWQVWVNRSADRYVNALYAKCAALAPPVASGTWGFGALPDLPRTEVFPLGGYDYPELLVSDSQVCPPGELGVGIHLRAGKFVDAVGLICGPVPVTLAPPATKVNPLATAPATVPAKVNPLAKAPVTNDMFSILKPASGERIAQGQLVLLVKPPNVGTPPVTVVEFKYLDAPPSNPFSYTLAVETSKLIQSYLVPQHSAPAYSGRWEVRVRTAAQPTPGPWSLPAQFQLDVVQPVQSQTQSSPIQQTSPLPSSAVTAPSAVQQTAPLPSSSVVQPSTQGSTSSSIMIRPRGVEEKTTGDVPTDSGKKP